VYAACLIITSAALGVDFGWQPTDRGELEYIIQIEPQSLESMRSGKAIQVGVPPELQHVKVFRVQIGNDELPQVATPAPLGKNVDNRPTSGLRLADMPELASTPNAMDAPEENQSLGDEIAQFVPRSTKQLPAAADQSRFGSTSSNSSTIPGAEQRYGGNSRFSVPGSSSATPGGSTNSARGSNFSNPIQTTAATEPAENRQNQSTSGLPNSSTGANTAQPGTTPGNPAPSSTGSQFRFGDPTGRTTNNTQTTGQTNQNTISQPGSTQFGSQNPGAASSPSDAQYGASTSSTGNQSQPGGSQSVSPSLPGNWTSNSNSNPGTNGNSYSNTNNQTATNPGNPPTSGDGNASPYTNIQPSFDSQNFPYGNQQQQPNPPQQPAPSPYNDPNFVNNNQPNTGVPYRPPYQQQPVANPQAPYQQQQQPPYGVQPAYGNYAGNGYTPQTPYGVMPASAYGNPGYANNPALNVAALPNQASPQVAQQPVKTTDPAPATEKPATSPPPAPAPQASSETKEKEYLPSWWPLMALGFLISIGANAYFMMISLDYQRKYQDLLEDVRDLRSLADN